MNAADAEVVECAAGAQGDVAATGDDVVAEAFGPVAGQQSIDPGLGDPAGPGHLTNRARLNCDCGDY